MIQNEAWNYSDGDQSQLFNKKMAEHMKAVSTRLGHTYTHGDLHWETMELHGKDASRATFTIGQVLTLR